MIIIIHVSDRQYFLKNTIKLLFYLKSNGPILPIKTWYTELIAAFEEKKKHIFPFIIMF